MLSLQKPSHLCDSRCNPFSAHALGRLALLGDEPVVRAIVTCHLNLVMVVRFGSPRYRIFETVVRMRAPPHPVAESPISVRKMVTFSTVFSESSSVRRMCKLIRNGALRVVAMRAIALATGVGCGTGRE